MNISEWESIKLYINSTVEKMLAVYDADKTNTVDYAMGSSGMRSFIALNSDSVFVEVELNCLTVIEIFR